MAQTFEKIADLLGSAKDVANDSFVCCILSHGREGEVFGSDSRPLEYTRIQRYLAKSEILRSRPKMLFIQASMSFYVNSQYQIQDLPLIIIMQGSPSLVPRHSKV